MSEAKLSWVANETEYIEPFKTSSKGLEPCALRLRLKEAFNSAETRTIMTPDFWNDFQPALKVGADMDELANTTGLGPDRIMLSVVIRDRNLNKFMRVYQCNVLKLPTKPIELTNAWSDFSQSGRIDLSVVATPLETKDRGTGIAFHKGDIVARRTFKIRTMVRSLKTPTRWALPEEFEQRGVSRETVWLINWLGEDLERPPVETVEILINEKYRETFQVLENDDEISNLIRCEMAAAIFSELALRATDADDYSVEETGFRQIMLKELSTAWGLSVEEILAKKDLPSFLGMVHAWAQNHVGLNNSFAKL